MRLLPLKVVPEPVISSRGGKGPWRSVMYSGPVHRNGSGVGATQTHFEGREREHFQYSSTDGGMFRGAACVVTPVPAPSLFRWGQILGLEWPSRGWECSRVLEVCSSRGGCSALLKSLPDQRRGRREHAFINYASFAGGKLLQITKLKLPRCPLSSLLSPK